MVYIVPYLLDGLDVSHIDDFLQLKVIVFIQSQEVNLLPTSTKQGEEIKQSRLKMPVLII